MVIPPIMETSIIFRKEVNTDNSTRIKYDGSQITQKQATIIDSRKLLRIAVNLINTRGLRLSSLSFFTVLSYAHHTFYIMSPGAKLVYLAYNYRARK